MIFTLKTRSFFVKLGVTNFVSAGLIACGLAGCSTVTPIVTDVDTPGMPNAEVALQKSMGETSTELTRIGGMQPAAAVASQPTVVPGELDRVVAMSWNGGLDGAVRKLAYTVGYRIVVSGNGSQSVNVVVNPTPQRVYDILHRLGDQAGELATVRVDTQHQLLEVIYHG
jgi:DotD protein